MKGRSKQIILNELMKEYKVGVDFNSIKLEKYSYSNLNNDSLKEDFEEITIDYNEATDTYNTDISYYDTSKIYQPYSLVISNIYDQQYNKILDSSYILYYNSKIGLKQLSYTFQEGNGLYNSFNGLTFNIDNYTLKTYTNSNNLETLYYNIDTIPNSSYNRFGISTINKDNFKVNNGIVSLKDDVLLTFTTMKNNIKSNYYTLLSIYDQFKYYEDIELEFENQKLKELGEDNITEESDWDNEISYNYVLFDQEISFIDDDYYNKKIVPILSYYADTEGKYPVKLSGNKLAFCKDLNQIKIIISNTINDNTFELSKDSDLLYPTTLQDLSSYLTVNYKDSRNRFQVNNYIESSSNFETINRIKYINTQSSKSIFNHYGISLNINLKNNYFIRKKSSNIYNLFTSNDDPLKIVYDHRDIKYCAYNIDMLNSQKFYLFMTKSDSSINLIRMDYSLINRLFNIGLIWSTKDPYIFIGYNTINGKNYYYPIWQNNISMYYYIPDIEQIHTDYNSITIKDYPHLNECINPQEYLDLCEVKITRSMRHLVGRPAQILWSINIVKKIEINWKYQYNE